MKNIEVTDEMYESLINISREINTQDNRCTANPYFFQVQTTKEIPTCEGCGEEIWVGDDGVELRNEDDIRGYITEKLYENDESDSPDDEIKIKAEKIVTSMDVSDLEDYLEDLKYSYWRKINVTKINEYENMFFTEKACEQHIKINGHNLNRPRSYVNHAYRNPEMELIVKFLGGLSK